MGNKKKNYKEEQLNYSLTYDDVVRIMKMVDDHEYSNLNIQLGDLKLEVNKEKGSATTSTTTSQESQVAQAAVTVEKPVEEAPKVEESEPVAEKETTPEAKEVEQPKEDTSGVEVKTTITGVFYEAPSPEEPAFVQVGSEVKKGDELGLIEVMKLFNSLTAPCDGVVKEILVENESIVETGDVLMVIEPS